MEFNDIYTKKELGQFFSGKAISKLLSCLADKQSAQNVIDPMCGIGDLLLDNYISEKAKRTGIEIDKGIYNIAKKRFNDSSLIELINGNVFDPEVIKLLSPDGYDLVITNPPYIRYQDINTGTKNGNFNSSQTRLYLKKHLNYFNHLEEEEKKFFEKIITNYSGLSDLAVPSWILCAMMTKKEGTLAIVVPEAWLNRNYAVIIKYLLASLFKIEYIIEDANSTWFLPAQVKTTLLIAKRIPKQSIHMWTDKDTFIYASIFKNANSNESLIGNMFDSKTSPEKSFLTFLKEGNSTKGVIESSTISLRNFAQEVCLIGNRQKWFLNIEKEYLKKNEKKGLKSTSSLKEWFDNKDMNFFFLEDIGVNISQGLRTGANFFFYLNFQDYNADSIRLFPGKEYNLPPFIVNKKYVKPIIRKQNELDNSYSLSLFEAKGVVLALQKYAIPEDILYTTECNPIFNDIYEVLPEELTHYIREASKIKIEKRGNKLIHELSAVKPNLKKWNNNHPNEYPRFWYMLPSFTNRHLPELFVPRVNNKAIKIRINDKSYLVDANFSTIWLANDSSGFDKYGLLALLNSTLFTTLAEEYGTVMGGGALKLEATQIKTIPLPILNNASIQELNTYGRLLANPLTNWNEIIKNIDKTIIIDIFGKDISVTDKMSQLLSIKNNFINKRN